VVGPEVVKEAATDDRPVLRRPRPHPRALYHAPGAVARHDAVAWGYGRGADQRGVEIHQQTEVLGIDVKAGKVVGVKTTRGYIATEQGAVRGGRLHPAHPRHGGRQDADLHPPAAGHGERADQALARPHPGVRQPAHLRQPVGPRRTGDGRLAGPVRSAIGTRSTLDFVEGLSTHMLEMFPFLST
jgi:sarcosine oxidase subunit beta